MIQSMLLNTDPPVSVFLDSTIDDCVRVHHSFLETLMLGADFAFEIFLDHKRTYRHSESRAESGVLDIDADGDLGIVEGCEAHESRMVFSMRVLRRSGLSGNFHV